MLAALVASIVYASDAQLPEDRVRVPGERRFSIEQGSSDLDDARSSRSVAALQPDRLTDLGPDQLSLDLLDNRQDLRRPRLRPAGQRHDHTGPGEQRHHRVAVFRGEAHAPPIVQSDCPVLAKPKRLDSSLQ